MSEKISLSVDTILKNASLSIFSDDKEIDCKIFADVKFDAEKLLKEIERILAKNGLNKGSVERLYISQGGLSLTRDRICRSTGLGLKNALGIELIIVDIDKIFQPFTVKSLPSIFIFEIGEGNWKYILYRQNERIEGTVKKENLAELAVILNEKKIETEIYATPDFADFVGNDLHFSKTGITYIKSNFSYYTKLNASDNEPAISISKYEN